MKKHSLTIWYRYSIADELETDFDYHEIEAESKEDAEIKARAMYTSLSKIVFKVEFVK